MLPVLARIDHRWASDPDRLPLTVALAASVALHLSFFALQAGFRGPAAQATLPVTRLEARLADPRDNAPAVIAAAAPAPFALPALTEPAPTPPLPETQPQTPVANRPSKARTARVGDLVISAHPVADRTRLGDLLDREIREFPAEIDNHPSAASVIRARYPPAALAAGREDVVAVWFIVTPQGEVEEITVTQGDPEFADAVTAAIREAKFLPAHNHRVPIAFPLSLEFRFVLEGSSPPATETAVAKP